MPPAARDATDPRVDLPAHSDPFVRGLSEAIGGPIGDHAVTGRRGFSGGGGKFWTPVRIILALTCVVLSLHFIQKSPCRDGAWADYKQYKYFCYTDVLALYYAERLHEGAVPYRDHPVEYPVLTGALMGVIGLPIHSLAADRPGLNQGQAFYDIHALVLGIFAVAAVAAILALRKRRPWDAAMFALAPGLWVSATVNWDLFVVGLTAIFMYAWAKKRPLLAGVFLGLATAAKFYPMFIIGALIVLALRTGRWKHAATTIGTGIATWSVLNVPVALAWRENWERFFTFNTERGIDWGTIWYIGAHFPRGDGQYGFSWFSDLNADPTHHTLNNLYQGLFALGCVAVAILTFLAPRKPRLAQLAFIIVALFLITGKVWSQQFVLWLIPLAILARPRWGAFLAWQVAEVLYFVSFYGELMGASGKQVFPEGVFVLASALRLITLCVVVGFVVRDILHPVRDDVRRVYDDDPDGGDFDGRADSPLVNRVRALLGLPPLTPAHPEGGPLVPEPLVPVHKGP